MNKQMTIIALFALYFSGYAADLFERECSSDDRLKMHKAVSDGDLEAVKRLFKDIEDMDIECSDGTGTTLLMIAAQEGRLVIAHFLFEKGANVDARNNAFWTPLHYAAGRGQKEMAVWLLQKGANRTTFNALNQTPEQTARQYYPDIANCIASYGRTKRATC